MIPIPRLAFRGRGLSRALLLACLLVLGAAAGAAPPDAGAVRDGYEYYHVGNLDAPTQQPVEAGLMLKGGGGWVDAAFKWLVAKGGHGHFVILRASGDDDLQNELYHDVGGVASVQTLVFHSRKAASDPVVLDIVRRADGIFIAGGDQSNYVRFWRGTPLNDLLNRHVREGRPLGGTSAGLAILGTYGYGAMDGGSITSPQALRDPMGPAVTLVDHFLDLPPLSGLQLITDSHFGKRQRLGRLLAFVAHLARQHGAATIKGLGIDEKTALCIDAQGRGTVFTGSDGYAWLVVPQRLLDIAAEGGDAAVRRYLAGRVEPGKPLDLPGFVVTGIGPHSRLQLPQLTVTDPAFRFVVDVDHGRLLRHPAQ